MTTATLHTSKGDIVIELFDNHTPKTVKNFVDLAKKDFYNGTIFHRVIAGFMIQGGCPQGTGTGDLATSLMTSSMVNFHSIAHTSSQWRMQDQIQMVHSSLSLQPQPHG